MGSVPRSAALDHFATTMRKHRNPRQRLSNPPPLTTSPSTAETIEPATPDNFTLDDLTAQTTLDLALSDLAAERPDEGRRVARWLA